MSSRITLGTAEGTRRESFGLVEWTLVAFLALTWGASFLFIDVALDSLAPGVITWLRALLGAAALALIPSARQPVSRESWPQIALLGLTWIAIPFTLFPIAQQWIDSSLAGILNAAMPLFAALISALMLRRLPGAIHVAGLVLGFIGVVLVTLPSWGESKNAALGIILVLLATVFYGFSANIAVPLQQAHGALPVVLRSQVVAAAATLPYALFGFSDSSLDGAGLAAVFMLGVFGTGGRCLPGQPPRALEDRPQRLFQVRVFEGVAALPQPGTHHPQTAEQQRLDQLTAVDDLERQQRCGEHCRPSQYLPQRCCELSVCDRVWCRQIDWPRHVAV
jgi:drug/metabolite transporter (DMT)-like permease